MMTGDQKAPLVRSPLFVFRLVVGLLLFVAGVGMLLVFEHALLGLRQDLTTIQAGWPAWIANVVEGIGGGAVVLGFLAGASNATSLPIPSGPTAAIVVGVLIALSGLLMAPPIGRKILTKNLLPAVKTAGASIAAIAKAPAKLAALFIGSAMVTVMYTVAMIASLHAFGASLAVLSAALVYLAGAAVATAAPTPGGVGATEAALVAGYTAVGIDGATTFAAVLLFRFVTFWLPILPGYIALTALQRRGDL